MKTIAIINQKGGCGKTTTAISLAGFFAAGGLRTLLVDLDPQSHCAAGLAIPEARIEHQIGDAMVAAAAGEADAIDPASLVWRVSRNLDLAPSTMRLASIEAPRGELSGHADSERCLARVLARLAPAYDACLVDCPPSIGLLTFNALAAADDVLIPVETGFFALQGATRQVSTIRSLGRRLGVEPPHWLLGTLHDDRSMLAKDLLDELHRRFGDRVIPHTIRYDTSLREAASFGQPIGEYATDSTGAEDYRALAAWLVERCVRSPRTAAPASTPRTEGRRTPDEPMTVGPSTSTASAFASLAGEQQTLVGLPVHPPGSRAADIAARARRLQAGAAARTAAAATPEVNALRLLGVRASAAGTVFVQPATLGQDLAVVGDFNAWAPTDGRMVLDRHCGVFELAMLLSPGRFEYRIVVDGRAIPDPHNPDRVATPDGECNSVVVVPQPC